MGVGFYCAFNNSSSTALSSCGSFSALMASSLVMAQGVGKDFRSRGGPLIDKDDHFQILVEYIVAARAMNDIALVPGIIFRRDDTAARQKPARHVHSRVQVSSRITAQVEHELGIPGFYKIPQGVSKKIGRICGKT